MLKHACSVSLLWPVSSVLAVPVRFAGTLVIVIDEVSMISAELLRTFENIVRKVVRSNGSKESGTWARRGQIRTNLKPSCSRFAGVWHMAKLEPSWG